MLGGLSLIAVLTAAITSGFVARAEASGQTTGDDQVITKLDELSEELRAVKTELQRLRPQAEPDTSA
jgi:hypothetical protein